jgi:hypothetical protein
MINLIIKEEEKITRQVLILDILMDHIKNTYLQEKWIFTLKTYNNLKNEIKELNNNQDNQLLKNYLINDYETLNQMISEFKEDIYDLFNPSLFLLIDSLNNQLLNELSIYQKNITNYNSYIYNIPIEKTKHQVLLLKNKLIETLSEHDKKYLNFNMIDDILNKDIINIETYIMICQIYKKTIKYLKEDITINEYYKEIIFNSIIILSGEKNVQ